MVVVAPYRTSLIGRFLPPLDPYRQMRGEKEDQRDRWAAVPEVLVLSRGTREGAKRPTEDRGMERLAGALQEGLAAQAGRPSRGSSVLLLEGGAGRAPTDREEVGDLASGSVSYPGKRSKTSLLARSFPQRDRSQSDPDKRPHKAAHTPIRIANAIPEASLHRKRLATDRGRRPRPGGFGLLPRGEGTPKASRRPRSLFSIEDRYIFSANTNRGRAPNGEGARNGRQRHGRRCLLRGERSFVDFVPTTCRNKSEVRSP